MCRLGGCGACENCLEDAWALVWRHLLAEDREWVVDQFVTAASWGGYVPNQDRLMHELRPSPLRWERR